MITRQNRTSASCIAAKPLWSSLLKNQICPAGLSLLLAGSGVMAAPSESAANEKPRAIVPVFRVDGPLSEVPDSDASAIFSVPGTSLKELVGRLAEAATDPAVKAVVLLPAGAAPGSAQIEELRAAIAVVRDHGKDLYVHADSLMLGQYVLACGASRISVIPTGPILI